MRKDEEAEEPVAFDVGGTLMAITAINPGDYLAEELEALGMTAAELARQLKVPTNRITEILKRRRSINGDTAIRLGHFFGASAEFWLNLRSLYERRAQTGRTPRRSKERLAQQALWPTIAWFLILRETNIVSLSESIIRTA